MTDKRGSSKGIVITNGVVAVQCVIRSDTGVLVVVGTTQSAASFAGSIGAPSVKNVDMQARTEQHTDGSHLFD
jgi:hypothetical protein